MVKTRKETPEEIEIEDIYSLAPAQQGMLFHSLESVDSGMYFNQVCCLFEHALDLSALERAWQEIVARHTILRTAFVWEGLDEPLQVVCRPVKLPVKREDWRDLPPAEQEERLESYLLADRLRGFDLSKAPLMRLTAIRLAESAYQLIWSHHHLLLDGWSISLLLPEVLTLYEAFGHGLAPPPMKSYPYVNYINWLRRQDLSNAESFWRRALKGFSASTPLGVDRAPDGATTRGWNYGQQEIRLSKAISAQLEALARRLRLTLNTLVQGAWALLLSYYSGEKDVVFGATVSGRPAELAGVEMMIGLFINVLPMRVRIFPNQSLVPWLEELQNHLLEMRRYEYSPLVKIQEWSEISRSLPLFESILGFENHPAPRSGRKGAEDNAQPTTRVIERTNYPLTVKVYPGRELALQALYDCRRFDDETIARLLEHWRTLLEAIANRPQSSLSELLPLTAEESERLLVRFNQTATAPPATSLLHQLISTQACRSPLAVAVRQRDQELSYGELERRANRLAHYLRRRGVGPERVVGLQLERSVNLIVALMGILKASGAFLPLDASWPRERLGSILSDAGAKVVVTQAGLRGGLPEGEWEVIEIDERWGEIELESDEEPEVDVDGENLAYVIYTSGSTGKPKGVMVHHRGITNYLTWATEAYAFNEGSGAPAHSPVTFDLTITSLFAPLLAGKTIVLVSEDEGIGGLATALRARRNFNMVKITPSHLGLLRQLLGEGDLKGLTKSMVIGGEALTYEAIEPWRAQAPEIRIINEYGPTETVVGCCVYEVGHLDAQSGAVPIGRPIANMQVYVLDDDLRPVPIGVIGELHIAGVGLARGYLNRSEITAEKFIPNPFSAEPGARLYKTGDLARRLPNGDSDTHLVFLGRRDSQVKVRGFRVELGEIAEVLNSHPAVHECVVITRQDAADERQLIAYLVMRQNRASSVSDLQSFLLERLPEYMIPTHFVTLDALPLNAHGKVNWRRLPATEEVNRDEVKPDFLAPRDALEEGLAKIWESVLKIKPIGVASNFFELGGHSILAVRLMAQVQKRFGQELPLNSLIRATTIESMADLIRRQLGPLDWSPVVEIQPLGSKRPFFCVHPIGGNMLRYRDLARHLGEDQPFYGLEAPGLADDRNHYVLIENIAAYYLDAVREVQPEGPYFLGGHSFGGFVAFEISQQLRRRGEEVALVALLDTPSPFYITKAIDDATLLTGRVREIGRAMGLDLQVSPDEISHLELPDQIAYILDWVRQRDILTEDMDPRWIGRFLDGLRARERAVICYKPDYCVGKITLFRASEVEAETMNYYESHGFDYTDPTLGWGKLAEEPVEVHVIPGYHDTIVFEPQVRVLADLIKACMDKAVVS